MNGEVYGEPVERPRRAPGLVVIPREQPRPLGTVERAILMAAEQAAVTAYDDTADGLGDVIRIDDLRDILARSTELRGAGR